MNASFEIPATSVPIFMLSEIEDCTLEDTSFHMVMGQLEDELNQFCSLFGHAFFGKIFYEKALCEFHIVQTLRRETEQEREIVEQRALRLQQTLSEVQKYVKEIEEFESSLEGLCEAITPEGAFLKDNGSIFLQQIQERNEECYALPLEDWKEKMMSLKAQYDWFFRLYLRDIAPYLTCAWKGLEERAGVLRQFAMVGKMYSYLASTSFGQMCKEQLEAVQKIYIRNAFLLKNNQKLEVPASEGRRSISKSYDVVEDGILLGVGTHKCVGKIKAQALFETRHCLKEKVLVKLLRPSREELHDLMWEAQISKLLRRAGVPYILKVQQVSYMTQKGESNSSVLYEHCTHGDLFSFVKEKREVKLLMTLALQMCRALQGMHACGYCHLDLKTTNVYVTRKNEGSFEIRLGDLSTVKKVGLRVGHFCSTYPAPEMQMNTKEYVVVEKSMDLWALGYVLLQLKRHICLFDQKHISYVTKGSAFSSLARAVTQEIIQKIGSTQDCVDQMIIRLLSYDAPARPSIEEVCCALELFIQTL